MRQPPWRWRRTAHRYNPAMTTFMNAALPANAALATVADTSRRSTSLPAGLTESDAARITAAISAARTESTRHVYALLWAQWERWCRSRGIPALPGDPLALYAYLTERAEAGKATGSTWPVPPSDTCTAWPAPRTLSPPRLSGRYAAGSCAPTARRPADWLARSPSTRSDRSFPRSTAPRRSGSATPRSSCSATPPRCVALRSWGSTSLTSNTSPLGSCSPSASRRGSGWSWSDGRRRSRTVRTHRPGGRGQCLASSAGARPPAPSSLAYGPARSASNRYRHMSQPACSAPGRRRRARRHPHHGTLFAGRPCTRRRDGRRPPGPDRGADKTQGPHRPGQPLHPAAGSPRDDVEPRPRAMTSAWGEDPWGQFGRPGAPLARSRSSAGSGPLTCGNACIQWPWGATGTHETR
jgi:hypothetical protein